MQEGQLKKAWFATVTERQQARENIAAGFRIRGYEISSPAMTNVLPFPRKQELDQWEPQKRRQKALKPQKMRRLRSQWRARRVVLQCRNLFLAALVGGLVTQYVTNSHSIQQLAALTSDGAGIGHH
jgi:hypothetical protein